jgi:tetratricopeptide (TPR) repeat protein
MLIVLKTAALYRAAQQALRRSHTDEARRLSLQLVAAHPDFADGHFLLALSEVNNGHLAAAIEALERALRLAPHAEYYAHYAKCLVLVRRDSEALRAADQAALLPPADALSLDTLGCVYSRLGMHDKAVPLFEIAVKQTGNHPQMRFNLASSLGFLGRFQEAADHYEKIIATNPDFVPAHSALSNLKKQSPTSNHIARLEALLPRVANSTDALHVRHALAKEFEDVGDYDSAFRHLAAANLRRKTELGYHINVDRRIFDQLMQRFAQVDYFRGASELTVAPIFIVGLPRTGTTLTDRILAAHPEVESAGELGAMPIAVKRLSGSASRRALDADIIDRAGGISPGALGRLYLDLSSPHRRQNLRFIDKLPLNFFYLGFIARALPGAKIVCLRRHPLDSVWSNYKHLFATNFSYYNYSCDLLDAAAYYVLFDRLMKFWRELLPGRILELKYESVVEDLEGQSRQLLAHCGLQWKEECLRFHENKSAVATPSGPQVRQPIYRGAVGRWRAYEHHLTSVREYLLAHGVRL